MFLLQAKPKLVCVCVCFENSVYLNVKFSSRKTVASKYINEIANRRKKTKNE